jgi:hypothetical protein
MPIRVNGILLAFEKIYRESILIQAIRKLVMSGSETGIGTPGRPT